MGHLKRVINVISLGVILFLSTCVSSADITREKAILDRYSIEKKEKYADLIVDIKSYTTSGDIYQKRFYKYLIGIAGDIVENKNLIIKKGSIGFYYDKKSGNMKELFLGLDINAGKEYSEPYGKIALDLLRKDLADIIRTINSCRTIFDEDHIVGIVIGWKWLRNGAKENVSIWILINDIIRFEKQSLTFDELIQRNTVTNTSGRIIRLPI